jgi:hypothetical protein
MDHGPSELINIDFHEAQPFVTGKQITGVVTFNNTSERHVKLQRIYAKFKGEAIYWSNVNSATERRKTFFQQLINLQEEQVRKLL